MKKITVLCESNSYECKETIVAPFEELQAVRGPDRVIVADACITGPDRLGRLIEKREGYSVYEERRDPDEEV